MRLFKFAAHSAFAFVALACFAAPARAQAPAAIPSGDYAIIDATINQRMNIDERAMVRWHSSSGPNNGEVFVKGVFDNEGLPCASLSQCSNPCRAYDMTFRGRAADGSTVDYQWSGERCWVNGAWTDRQIPTQTKFDVLQGAPVVADVRTASVTTIQQNLTYLRYYSGVASGQIDDSTRSAITEFMSDEEMTPSTDLTDDDLQAVAARTRQARARIQHTSASACSSNGQRYVACGVN